MLSVTWPQLAALVVNCVGFSLTMGWLFPPPDRARGDR